MSIGPTTIDRTGERPCLPTGVLLAVARRLAEGRPPTLRQRVVAAIANLRQKIAR